MLKTWDREVRGWQLINRKDFNDHTKDIETTNNSLTRMSFSPKKYFFIGIVTGVLLSISIMFPLKLSRSQTDTLISKTSLLRSSSSSGENSLPIVTYECPAEVVPSINDKDGNLEAFYFDESDPDVIQTNTSDVHHYQTWKYDGWGSTYTDFKEHVYTWKAKHFRDLRSGDLIYESACGKGLNLVMTLEILRDEFNITDLVVYGNDYFEKSVEVARRIFEEVTPAGGKKGVFCRADSTDLSFVPSDSFDLAYTGYIDPLIDPLNIFDKMSSEKKARKRLELCNVAKGSKQAGGWERAKLASLDQAAQEEWYSKWVSELVRITKPGKGIVVEQISHPICDDFDDWGGVSKEWWVKSVSRYGWDVDVNSISFENSLDDDQSTLNRYNLFMRKNGKKV